MSKLNIFSDHPAAWPNHPLARHPLTRKPGQGGNGGGGDAGQPSQQKLPDKPAGRPEKS